MLEAILLVLTIASWVYWIVAWWWVRELTHPRARGDPEFTPPVTILKPVKGLDFEAYENLRSFCEQDYPEFELLVGVADSTDPVIPVVERVRRDFPGLSIRLVIAPTMHVNRKASLLHALASQARYDVLVASDSDMRVTPDYLRRVVAPFADQGVGAVTCPYRGGSPATLTARLEALHMGVTFLPSVTVARRFLNMHFALGATIALRKNALDRIGGFEAVADYLADDYQLGMRIANLGLRVQLFIDRWASSRLRHYSLVTTDRVYGLMQTGQMKEEYVLGLLRRCQPATAELYFHPTTAATAEPLGPNPGDLATLLSPALRQAVQQEGIRLVTYPALAKEKKC